jgi:hypothetical protein
MTKSAIEKAAEEWNAILEEDESAEHFFREGFIRGAHKLLELAEANSEEVLDVSTTKYTRKITIDELRKLVEGEK